MTTNPTPASSDSPGVKPRRRWVRGVVAALVVVVVAAGCATYWALDRFVIDDVAIADVAAHEASIFPPVSETHISGTTIITTTTLPSGGATTGEVSPTVPDGLLDLGLDSDPSVHHAATPVVTETSYRSDAMNIDITPMIRGEGDDQVVYYVADVTLASTTTLRGGFAENKFGNNIIEDTSDIAKRYAAVWAINGDYYGFRESGIVIRNGVLFRDDPARTGFAVYKDGRAEIYDEKSTTGAALLATGVWNTLSFGPPLVDDSKAVPGIDQIEIDTNFGNHSVQGSHPRTGIGIIAPNHFVFIAVDGRSKGYSRGVTLPEFADLFVELGAKEAYNLDGGGSTTMYFDGELVNSPLGKNRERGTSDVLYLAEPTVTG